MTTVRIKIAVAINEHGHWNAIGFCKWSEKEARDCALEGLDEQSLAEMMHCVEADIPIPEGETITGTVESTKEGK